MKGSKFSSTIMTGASRRLLYQISLNQSRVCNKNNVGIISTLYIHLLFTTHLLFLLGAVCQFSGGCWWGTDSDQDPSLEGTNNITHVPPSLAQLPIYLESEQLVPWPLALAGTCPPALLVPPAWKGVRSPNPPGQQWGTAEGQRSGFAREPVAAESADAAAPRAWNMVGYLKWRQHHYYLCTFNNYSSLPDRIYSQEL